MREKALIQRLGQRWLQAGLCTAPADRPQAEAAVADLYRAAGLEPPRRPIWVLSPLQGAAAATAALFLNPSLPAPLRAPPSPLRAGWEQALDGAPPALTAAICRVGADGDPDQAWEPLRRRVWAVPGAGGPPEDPWGFGPGHWDPVRAALGERFDAEAAADLARRLARLYEDLAGFRLRPLVQLIVTAVDRLFPLDDGHVQPGQHAAPRAAVAEYLRLGLGATTPAREALCRLARSCGWWWPYRGAAILSERPCRLRLDPRGRLHAEDGPAIQYPDGWGLHAWHGREVPERLITRPETITLAEVLGERHVETRRLLLERMGYLRLILESGARPLHTDRTGALYRIELPHDEPLVLVHVTDGTPAPDGSRRRHVLRVPPHMRRARQAVAWTFGLSERAYAPARET